MAIEPVKLNTETIFGDLMIRLGKVEEGQNELIRKNYEFDKELSKLEIDLKYIREGLDQTKGGINKLLWGIAGVFITTIVSFVLQGGYTVVN
jgi:hypothetical protein